MNTKYSFAVGRIMALMMALIPAALVAVTPVAAQQVLAQTQDARKAQADLLLQP